MKKIVFFLLYFGVWLKADAQSIIQYEYWYDSDYSSSTVVNTSPTSTFDLSTSLTATSLTFGLHSVNFRAKDDNGKWSSVIKEHFYATGNMNIDSYEYWFDDDYAAKITNTVAPSQTYILTSDFDTSTAGYGLHALNFRSKDNTGKWSVVIKEFFFKSVGGTQLTNAEYWIDSNFANRQSLPFTSSDTVFIDQSVLTSNLDDQLHTFNFRMQDQAGKWSVVTSSYFMAQSLIVGYEYWFDDNYAQKTYTAITPSNLLENEPDFEASTLSNGVHVVHFRAKNDSGKYSVAISQAFTVNITDTYSITASAGADGNISPNGVTNVLAGLSQTYTITPNTCYQIEDVVVDGVSQGAITSYTFTNVTTVHDISVTFVSSSMSFYQDADNDGYGNPTVTTSACTAPVGYVLNSLDCNDANAAVHPGATEICYDGIDNNCDGTIDEGCTPIISTLQTTQCGIILPLINSNIYANLVSGAQGYRFKVTDMVTNQVQTIDKLLRVFSITQLGNYAFDRQYKVEVAIRYNNVWQPFYGSPCFVTTPATTSQVQSTQCGATLATMGDVIYADNVPYCTGYKFRIINLSNAANSIIVDRPTRDIRLNNNVGFTPEFNSTYSVEVAIKNTNGSYLPYGTLCNVSTPSFPTTQLQLSQCDALISSNSTIILADSYSGASQYRFRFTNSSQPYTYVFDKSVRSFTLSSVPGLLPATTYTVQVALNVGGVFGPYGKSCTITTPGGAREQVKDETTVFQAVAYPNPFAENFKLDVTASSDEMVNVRVYDMLGKQVEDRTINVSAINDIEIGTNYPSGVYNVIVSEGNEVKTLRVIKR